jgi:hypothetical protein
LSNITITRLLAALCAIAPIIPLFVDPFDDYNPVIIAMSDGIVQPRLAAVAACTGVALVWIGVVTFRREAMTLDLPLVLWTALGLFVLVNVLAVVFAEDWRASIAGERLRYQGLAATLLYVLLFGVAAYAIRTLADLKTVARPACFDGRSGQHVCRLPRARDQRVGLPPARE